MRIAVALVLCVALASCASSNKAPSPSAYLVFFPSNSANLLPNAARILNGVAADANRQGAVVEVSGPLAKRTKHRKATIAEQRTVAVEHALEAAGVPPARLHRVPAVAATGKANPGGEPVKVRLVIKPTV